MVKKGNPPIPEGREGRDGDTRSIPKGGGGQWDKGKIRDGQHTNGNHEQSKQTAHKGPASPT